ncbi:hypothetical protein ABG067_002168 [Albugo candida]
MERFQSQECLICLNELQTNLATIQCGHVFHLICIKEALKYKEQCPICRKSASRSFITPLYFNLFEASAHVINVVDGESNAAVAMADSANVQSLTARMHWQKDQMHAQSHKIKRLRDHLKILSAEKKCWDEKYDEIALIRTDLMNKVTRYRLEVDRQANLIQRLSINKAVAEFLSTEDPIVLERELIDPGNRILALKKACQYRTKQYHDAVKEKNSLKSALEKMEQHIQSHHCNISDVKKRRISKSVRSTLDEKKRKLIINMEEYDNNLLPLDAELSHVDTRPYSNRSSFFPAKRNGGICNTFSSFTSTNTLGLDRLHLSLNNKEHKRKAKEGGKITDFLISNMMSSPQHNGHKKARRGA